eukprot:scaffold244_cov416-Prasinococcus_capsulatus_cf.AAC.6
MRMLKSATARAKRSTRFVGSGAPAAGYRSFALAATFTASLSWNTKRPLSCCLCKFFTRIPVGRLPTESLKFRSWQSHSPSRTSFFLSAGKLAQGTPSTRWPCKCCRVRSSQEGLTAQPISLRPKSAAMSGCEPGSRAAGPPLNGQSRAAHIADAALRAPRRGPATGGRRRPEPPELPR